MAVLARVRVIPVFRTVFLILVALALWISASPEEAHAQSVNIREYQIKAAFLFNFLQFVKWPPTTFTTSNAPFKIGILGDDPFGSALDDTVEGEVINGHRLTVVRSPRVEELEDCQMVFVSSSESDHLDEILADLRSKPILTIGEVEDFARKGGDIDFYLAGGRVRFEINPQSARQCGLQISSQLLALGRIVAP